MRSQVIFPAVLVIGALLLASARCSWEGRYVSVKRIDDYYEHSTTINIFVVDLASQPLWSPPGVPSHQQFRDRYPDVPAEMGPEDAIKRVARYDIAGFEFVLYLTISTAVSWGLLRAVRREGKRDLVRSALCLLAGMVVAAIVPTSLGGQFTVGEQFYIFFLIAASVFVLVVLALFLYTSPVTWQSYTRENRYWPARLGGAVAFGFLFVAILSQTPCPKMVWGAFAYAGRVCENCGAPATRTAHYGAAASEAHYCEKCDPPSRKPVSFGPLPTGLGSLVLLSIPGAFVVLAIANHRALI